MSERYTMLDAPHEPTLYLDNGNILSNEEVLDLLNQFAALRKRIAEPEAGPHIVDPTQFDYTSEGKPVRDLTRSPAALLSSAHVWYSDAQVKTWDKHGNWCRGITHERDLIPTPKLSKKEQE